MAAITKAGFFSLNLRFLNDVDNAQISYMKGEQTVELRTAPPCMVPVIRNIEAVLTFIQPLYKRHGLFMMEQIHNEYPDNINTVANLIEIKKKLQMDTKAHEEKLAEMQSNDGNRLEQARCLLEIGYILLTDVHAEVQKSVDEKLADICKQLEFQTALINAPGKAETFGHAFIAWRDATNNIKHLLPESCLDGTKREQTEAIKYFEDGLAMMTPGTETGIWKHNLARAHSRVGTADRNISRTSERKKHMIHALQNFLECISEIRQDTDPLKVYVARSYAYVGHLIATRNKEIKGKEDPIPSFIDRNQKFRCLWEDPMEAFKRAHSIFDDDRVVHSRHGLTLKDKRISTQNEDYGQRIRQAIQCFNNALRIEKIHNWFAYSQLCQAYMELYKFEKKLFLDNKDPEPNKNNLDEAIKNGQLSLQQRVTSKTLLNITEAFYLKAVKPKTEKGLEIIEDLSCISTAQEFIQRAIDHHDCKEHEKLRIFLGKCLFHKGDKKAGIEEMLDVLTKDRNTITEPHYFRELLIMMINEFRTWKDDRRNEAKSRQRRQKLRKIWCVLVSGKMTYKKRLKHPLIGILNLYPHEFIVLLREVYSFKTRSKEDQELANECLDALKNHNGKDVKRRAREIEEIQPEETDSIVNHQGQVAIYDCCICYSKEDAIWTKTFIEDRRHIQKWKPCLKVEGLRFGERMKFLFIISDSFNRDPDCMAMLSAVKGNHPTSNRLIPVLKYNATSLPELLKDVQPIDFTALKNNSEKLTAALLQPIDDFNVPGAPAIQTPMVDVSEGIPGGDSDGMEVDEPTTAKRTKTDNVTDGQVHDTELSWAEQVQKNSEEPKDETEMEAHLGDSGQSLPDNAEMDSGFVSGNI
ncbi:uncharacterized protein LOC117326929 [Pecten maximus]|uniref:uncharacterized protein LOC117326929 n=1 Tax=Pecten maximus TaxID=6579 RepID=UPI001458460E|nr:uncharacterized protein LOC117326929 [Pecten maximus]